MSAQQILLIVLCVLCSSTAFSKGSISMHTASEGWLEKPAEIPANGQYHRVLGVTRARGHLFATDELIEGLLRAARIVSQRKGGAKLVIGNLSRRKGGDISSSVSHNSGRDADVAFFTVRPDGTPTTPSRYYHCLLYTSPSPRD